MHKNEISHFFIYNLLVPKAFLKQVIFYTFFPTIRTCVQFSMIIMPRNLYFATETLNEIGYQKIRSHWLFPKRFGMILGIKVVKCVKIVRKKVNSLQIWKTPCVKGETVWDVCAAHFLVIHVPSLPMQHTVFQCILGQIFAQKTKKF